MPINSSTNRVEYSYYGITQCILSPLSPFLNVIFETQMGKSWNFLSQYTTYNIKIHNTVLFLTLFYLQLRLLMKLDQYIHEYCTLYTHSYLYNKFQWHPDKNPVNSSKNPKGLVKFQKIPVPTGVFTPFWRFYNSSWFFPKQNSRKFQLTGIEFLRYVKLKLYTLTQI